MELLADKGIISKQEVLERLFARLWQHVLLCK